MRFFAACSTIGVALATLACPREASANGSNSHIWIATQAIEHLPQGSLRALLAAPSALNPL